MPRETVRAKALRFIDTKRIRLVRGESTAHRLAFDVLGDSSDPMQPEPYRVVIEWLGSALVESCTCANPRTNCSHIAAARIFSEISGSPTPQEES